jgi:hypothetical protein
MRITKKKRVLHVGCMSPIRDCGVDLSSQVSTCAAPGRMNRRSLTDLSAYSSCPLEHDGLGRDAQDRVLARVRARTARLDRRGRRGRHGVCHRLKYASLRTAARSTLGRTRWERSGASDSLFLDVEYQVCDARCGATRPCSNGHVLTGSRHASWRARRPYGTSCIGPTPATGREFHSESIMAWGGCDDGRSI